MNPRCIFQQVSATSYLVGLRYCLPQVRFGEVRYDRSVSFSPLTYRLYTITNSSNRYPVLFRYASGVYYTSGSAAGWAGGLIWGIWCSEVGRGTYTKYSVQWGGQILAEMYIFRIECNLFRATRCHPKSPESNQNGQMLNYIRILWSDSRPFRADSTRKKSGGGTNSGLVGIYWQFRSSPKFAETISFDQT